MPVTGPPRELPPAAECLERERSIRSLFPPLERFCGDPTRGSAQPPVRECGVQLEVPDSRARQVPGVGNACEGAPPRELEALPFETQCRARDLLQSGIAAHLHCHSQGGTERRGQRHLRLGAPVLAPVMQLCVSYAEGDRLGVARQQRTQRAARDVDFTAAPARENAGARAAHVCGRVYRHGRCAARSARKVDVGALERNSPGLEASAARHAPGVQPDGKPRRAQPHYSLARLAELDVLEHRLGAVPAPAHREAPEAHLEPGLVTDQLLERCAVLRHARCGELVRHEQERRHEQCATQDEQGRAQVCGNTPPGGACGAAGGERGSPGWRCTHHLKPSDEYDVVLVNAVESLDLQADRPAYLGLEFSQGG